MRAILGRWSEPVYALLRFVAGAMFACHGAQKVLGAFGKPATMHEPLTAAAGIIELGCGILIALGLLTSPAAFLASGEMAVAFFKVHASSGKGIWPILNGGELAVLYCFVFLYLSAHGSGRYSLDHLIGRGRLRR